MTYPYRFRVFAAFAMLVFFTSCSKSNEPGKMVPKEAGFIMHVNSKSLYGKINMAELKESDWYKKMMEDLSHDSIRQELAKKFVENARTSGLDTLSDLILFADNSRSNETYVVMQWGLKDEKAFAHFFKNVYPEGNINKDGNLQTMTVKDKAVITWNNEKVMVGFETPPSTSFSPMGSSGGYNADDSAAKPNHIPQIIAYCKNLFSLKEENSMAKDEKFTDLMNTDGDIHAWVNLEKLMSGIPQMGMMSMMKLDKFFDGNINAYTLNFDNGRVTLKSKGYTGKELNDIFKKYNDGGINTAMLKNIPSQDLAGVLAMHFNPEGLKALVKMSGMDGLADLFLSRHGITIDDFIKANKGDLLIAVADLTVKKDSLTIPQDNGKSSPYITDRPDAKFIFAASINDREAFNKLVNFAKKQSGDLGMDKTITYNTGKDYFVIGNSSDYISRYLAGGKTDLPYFNKISNNPIGLYIDLQKIIKAFGNFGSKDSISKKISEESLKIWENITLSGGNYSGGGINHLLEINMVDKNTNSLKQLIKYLVTIAAMQKEKESALLSDMDKIDQGISFP